MKANVIRCAAQGNPEVMQMESVNLAEPGQGEVLIRQTAIGLNFMDVCHRGGQYPLAEVKQAHQDLEAGKTAGSSLLLP